MKVRLPQNRKNVLQQPLCSEEDEEVTFMLDESAVGLSVEQDFSYTWRDLILYNLSVGAKQEELEYVYEKGLKAVPTFGVIPCTATFGTEPYSEQPLMPTKKIEGLRSDGTLHMDHKLVIHKPISKEGKLHLEKVISAVYDRGEGKGAKINVDIIAKDEAGDPVFTNTMGYLNRWAGGFGGPKVPHSTVVIPADSVVLALGVRPRSALAESFESCCPQVHIVGDARRGGRIATAVREGFEAAYIFEA